LHRHKDRVSEAKSRGEPKQCDRQKNDFADSERMNADQYHCDYGIYEHRTCQNDHPAAADEKVKLGSIPDRARPSLLPE
jgi:hypothetical protein